MTNPNPGSAPKVTVKSRNRRELQMLELDQKTLKPERHYRWVRCRKDEHMSSVTKHKLKGYELETEQGGVKTIVEPDKRPDGVIGIGDLVLMSCPKEIHEERTRDRKSRQEAMLANTSAETERMAREKGIKVIKDPD